MLVVLVLPAHAGMIPGNSGGRSRSERAPRSRGDDPAQVADDAEGTACSPLTRG